MKFQKMMIFMMLLLKPKNMQNQEGVLINGKLENWI